MISTTQDWAKLLRGIAGPRQFPTGDGGSVAFADEAGHRRAVDEPFLAWLLSRTPKPAADSAQPDVLIWDALARSKGVPQALWDLHQQDDWRSNFDAGSLFPQRDSTGPITIEVWTEVELSSLHALAWMADEDADLRPLVRRTVRWLIENLQPDNATNHPWAIHVFAAVGVREGNDDASMYAQTLLHNCQVSQGRPDAFSALILSDAADALESASLGDWLTQDDQR